MAISQIISLFLLHLLLPLACISLSQSSHQLMCEVGTGNGGSIGGISWLPASLSKLLIKGGTVVNAHRQERADVYVEDGIIVAVKPNIKESGQISVTDYVRITSTECARIFNIYPRKGAILVGSGADVIIFNPNSSFEINPRSHHSRTNTNVYEGRKGKGKVEVTISRGRIVWKDDELKVAPGSGKYIPMPPSSFLFDGIGKTDAKLISSFKAPVHRFKSDV